MCAGDEGGNEPPLKRARSSSAGLDASSTALGAADSADCTPGFGTVPDGRDGTPGDASHAGWRTGEDRESRDGALNAELARYMIRTEPLGTDRHHQRYWYMQVRRCCCSMCTVAHCAHVYVLVHAVANPHGCPPP